MDVKKYYTIKQAAEKLEVTEGAIRGSIKKPGGLHAEQRQVTLLGKNLLTISAEQIDVLYSKKK